MNENKFTHLDLFSGIGGFALAAKWAGFCTKAFCEVDAFAQKVLRKNFPGVQIHDDVRKLDGKKYQGTTILSGGFPCQPYSQIGKRRGEKDDRALWTQMARIIQEARPSWVVGENVLGLVSLELDEVLDDLENIGYSTEALIVPACSVDAPHRRDRVWIIANSEGERGQCRKTREQGEQAQLEERLSRWSNTRIDSQPKWPTESGVPRMDDGVPNRLHRLKGLGNAIVPQVAYEFFRYISEIERFYMERERP